jgi:hypothetical protein
MAKEPHSISDPPQPGFYLDDGRGCLRAWSTNVSQDPRKDRLAACLQRLQDNLAPHFPRLVEPPTTRPVAASSVGGATSSPVGRRPPSARTSCKSGTGFRWYDWRRLTVTLRSTRGSCLLAWLTPSSRLKLRSPTSKLRSTEVY